MIVMHLKERVFTESRISSYISFFQVTQMSKLHIKNLVTGSLFVCY